MANGSGSVSLTDFGQKRRALQVAHPRWWEAERVRKGLTADAVERLTADAINAAVEGMKRRQDWRVAQLVSAARLYGNSRLLMVSGTSAIGAMMTRPKSLAVERLTDNVIQSVIDVSTARVGENKPRPYYLTDGGNWTLQRRAKALNKFTDGLFYETDAYSIGSDCQRDCQVFGDGFAFVRERHGRVVTERVLGAELWIDEAEAAYGHPWQMHWGRPVDREQLAAEFPEARQAIYDAPRANLIADGFPQNDADLVQVVESWHLRSGPEAEDGKHCVSIDGHLIEPLTDWPHDFFPFARWRWSPRPMGFWSQGVCEQLQGKQIELNRLLWTIQESMRRAGTYKVFLEAGSKVVKQHISNEIGAIIEYKGTPPTYFVPEAVSPQHYEQWQRIRQSMFEQVGVPLMTATGQKPPGLNSGEAQRQYRDTTNEAMKTKDRLNADAYLELAKVQIAIAREVAKREGHYEVRAPSGRRVDTVRLKASDLDPSGFEMRCFPTSSLPKDPAGRTQTTTEWVQAGWLTQRQAKRLMDLPDLEAVDSLQNAAEDILCRTLDAIADEGEYAPPEPTDDLQLAQEMVVEYINRGRAQGLEEENMDLLRTYQLQLQALMQLAMPPVPPPMPGMPGLPGGAPQAMPMAPPTSELLPNAPPG